MDAWVEHELAGGTFPDQRLKTRLGRLLGDLGERIGGTLPMACRDWAATLSKRKRRESAPQPSTVATSVSLVSKGFQSRRVASGWSRSKRAA